MAISIKTCPHCNHTMSETYSIGIGKPFAECSNCGKMVIDRDTTEWELKNIFQKLFFLVTCLYTAIIVGVIPVLIYGFSVDNPSDTALLGIWLGTSCCVALFSSRNLVEEINASKERMKDPDYRQVLQSVGLLTR